MARLLKHTQPRLWEHAARLRNKRPVATLLDTIAMTPVLHVSQRYPAARLCAAAVLPLARHPPLDNRVNAVALQSGPDALLDRAADALAERRRATASPPPQGGGGAPNHAH